MVLSDDEVRDAISLNHEVRIVEFKSAGSPSDRAFLAKVARACLAMANQRGGGHVLIGVDDSDPTSGPSGLATDQLLEWRNFDEVSNRINQYADPPLRLEVEARHHPSGTDIIVLGVEEFHDIPILCKKAFDRVLERGHLYTRSIAKPESSIYHSHAELREVLELGVQKGLRAFLDTVRHAGIELGPTQRDLFVEGLAPFYSDGRVEAITALPHFTMLFLPNVFESERVTYNELEIGLARAQVRVNGGAFPPLGSDTETSQHAITWHRPFQPHTAWRFDQSGAFVLVQKLGEYQRDSDAIGNPDDPRISGYVPIRKIVAEITRALALAARLMNLMDLDAATCELGMSNIRGRTLVVNDPSRSGLFADYIYGDEAWNVTLSLNLEHRTSGTLELAIDVALGLLHRFGWTSVTRDMVAAMQTSYLNG